MFNRILKLTVISIVASSSLYAYSLKQSVQRVLETNPEVIAEKNNHKAFRKYIDERKGNFYPRIDIDGTIERSTSKKDYDQPNRNNLRDRTDKEDGYNVGLALNQILYDGDLTPSQVREARHNEDANRFRTQRNIENVVFETINAYTGLVQYNELLVLTQNMIKTNEENLEIAKEKEAISGEILETYQVDSKLNFVKEKYIEEKDLKSSRTSSFKRYVGLEPQGDECRPTLDKTQLPNSLQEIVKKAVLNNNEIKEQIERIKAQREKIAQADAAFLPTFNLELKVLTDNDLSLNEEGKEEQAFGRITLAWNLYNGGGDHAVSVQEAHFLAEQKKRLDGITNKVVEEVKVTYQRYKKNLDRIEVLKKYVLANENIVEVYKSEFEAGTRTFVDILDAQTVLYEARKSLVNREYEVYSNYYTLLNAMSILSTNVLNLSANECKNIQKEEKPVIVKKKEKLDVSDELSALLGDEEAEEKTKEVKQIEKKEESLVEKSVEKINEELSLEETSSSKGLEFLDVKTKAYTINIATTNGLNAANNFVKINSLDSNKAYTYEFGPEMKSAKVIYGIFDTAKEARKAISNLPSSVKATKPYVDNISKHQKLYKKYH